MVDAQSRTEHTLQSACHLYGEGYLGQEIEHLTALFNGFLNEMDVYLGLAARRDAMQQHHILAHKLHSNLVHGVLLCLTQRLDVLGRVFSPTPYASHLTMIHLKKAARRELAQYGIGGVGGILQFVASHLLYVLRRRFAVNLVPVRQYKILAEGLLLLQRTGQCGHGDVQRMLCAQIGWQRDAANCLRTIAVFGLQSGWKSRLEHVAKRTHIICGNPLPQPELAFGQDGTVVNHLKNVARVKLGFVVMRANSHGCVRLGASEGHDNTHAHAHLWRKRVGY